MIEKVKKVHNGGEESLLKRYKTKWTSAQCNKIKAIEEMTFIQIFEIIIVIKK